MRKKNIYKSNFNFRAEESIKKGVYALDRSTILGEFTMKFKSFKSEKFSSPFSFKMSGLLKTFVVMEFIQTTPWELGEKINLFLRNLAVIYTFVMPMSESLQSQT